MRKIILLIFPLMFFSRNAQAAPAVCGLKYDLANMSSSSDQINLAAYLIVEDTDKENCKKILSVLTESQKGNNNFEKMIKDIAAEAKFDSDIKIDLSKMKMNWMLDCAFASHGFRDGEMSNVCTDLETQKLYILGIHGKPTIKKLVLDKKLDSDEAFEELNGLLN